MSIASINNSLPHLTTNGTAKNPLSPEEQDRRGIALPTEGEKAREAQSPVAESAPAEKAGADKNQAAKKFLADRVSISPEGQAASKALLATLGGLKPAPVPAEKPEPKAAEKDDAPKPHDQPAAAPAEKKAPAAPQGGPGGGGEGSEQEKKLKELKKEARELQAEITRLENKAANDEAAAQELQTKSAEKGQVDAKIKALEQQMRGQAAQA